MKHSLLPVILVGTAVAGLLPLFAAAPVDVAEVAPLEDLVFEVNARVAELEKALATEDSYNELRDLDVRRAFGVLACLGQAIAEHKDLAQTKIAGPTLRNAALRFNLESTFAEAKEALQAVQAAQGGKADAAAVVEHDWAQLIEMLAMMEEIETRSGKLVRVVRRPRGTPEESAHASTIAVLTVAMMADTHTLTDEADIPQWKEMSREYQQLMTKLASAIRDKDRRSAGDLLIQATQSCDRCHATFRDQ
jgi:hypothetical protein